MVVGDEIIAAPEVHIVRQSRHEVKGHACDQNQPDADSQVWFVRTHRVDHDNREDRQKNDFGHDKERQSDVCARVQAEEVKETKGHQRDDRKEG